MLFRSRRIYKDVVYISRAKVVKVLYKDIINKSLENRRTINNAKGKNFILIRVILGAEGRIILALGGHINVIEGLLNIKLCEDLCLINTYYYLIN